MPTRFEAHFRRSEGHQDPLGPQIDDWVDRVESRDAD